MILSSLVLADYTIESMEFMTGDDAVTHILPQHAQVVDIVVNISTNESFVGLKGDLTKVNPNPTKFTISAQAVPKSNLSLFVNLPLVASWNLKTILYKV
jgi:hypothetical protein